ncbi:MAG TPA: hypothetical protein VK479_03190 [Micropepsaceae bacterium]|nr:hypothetical protein [Micropepsaceae bacterium]
MSINDAVDRLLKYETAKVSLEAAAMRKGVVPSAIEELVEVDSWAEQFLASGKTAEEFIDALAKSKPHIMPDVLCSDEIERGRVAFATLKGQGDYVKANGLEAATKMAAALGVKLGTLLKTAEPSDGGQQQQRPNGRPAAPRAESNPFRRDPIDHAEIAALIKRLGCAGVSRLAASAGTDISGRPLRRA